MKTVFSILFLALFLLDATAHTGSDEVKEVLEMLDELKEMKADISTYATDKETSKIEDNEEVDEVMEEVMHILNEMDEIETDAKAVDSYDADVEAPNDEVNLGFMKKGFAKVGAHFKKGKAKIIDYTKNVCFFRNKELCGSDLHCCPNFPTGVFGKCSECCVDADCISKVDQPPAGEFGKPFCVKNRCQAYKNGFSSQIPSDGYVVYTPSETIDGAKEFRPYKMPRKLYKDGPLMEQVWHFDFNEQDESFDKSKIEYNDTHITIPSFDNMHAGYSRSYNHYDEHETGVVATVMADNKYSVVADYPKLVLVEKYHTLTYDGIINTARGDYIKKKAKEQLAKQPEFDSSAWRMRMYPRVFQGFAGVLQQVQSGIDRALSWQVRRYVNSYPKTDFGSVNPSSSASWASHSKKAKQAIAYAKDPTFKRKYMKSEQHCKHFEQLDGVSYTEDSVTFPLDRPITTIAGEMVNSPVHYLGLGVGHATVHYDPTTSILEIFYQTFSHSRQHGDVKFPGPYPNGLWVAPVADGKDYVVDPERDGRGDTLVRQDAPKDILQLQLPGISEEEDFTVWARPTEEVCSDEYKSGRDSDFWEEIDLEKSNWATNNIFEYLRQNQFMLEGVVESVACANPWMRSDYDGGHNFDVNEIGVYAHSLSEIRDDKTKELMLANYWDAWECLYAQKCE